MIVHNFNVMRTVFRSLKLRVICRNFTEFYELRKTNATILSPWEMDLGGLADPPRPLSDNLPIERARNFN